MKCFWKNPKFQKKNQNFVKLNNSDTKVEGDIN